ncbi:MAG: molybdopterin-dependent oxidoreductase [Egibacteraceae bacterium]
MAARQTNLGLLVLLALALLTGTVAFGIGVPAGRAVAIAHGVVGAGLIVLSPWKAAIVRRGMRRARPGRAASVALATLVVATVLTGIAHTAGWRVLAGGVTTMQAHVGAALATIPLGVWHVVARPAPLRRTDLSRRAALRAGRVLSVAGLVWGATEAAIRLWPLPGRDRRFTGSHELGTDRPGRMPVTQWFTDTVPHIDGDTWRLTVTDANGSRVLSLRDLTPQRHTRATIDCTGGWFATQDWEGTPVRDLVGDAGDARSILVVSHTGYARRLPLRDLDTLLLATHVGGAPLSPGHGFPARLVAPGRRGFWWVKWVTEIRTDPTPWWAQPPFPLT